MNTSSSKSDKTDKSGETPETDALLAEIAALRREFKALLDKIGAEAADVAEDTAKRGRAAGAAAAEELVEDWREIDRKVLSVTREHPWRTLGIAAIAGLLLGVILRR